MSIAKVTRTSRGKVYTYFAVRFTDPGTGKERIKYFGTLKEARAAEPKLRMNVSSGRFNAESYRITVAEVAKRWRDASYAPRKTDKVRPATAASYEVALKGYILPRWGAVALKHIKVSHLEKWTRELLDAGRGASTVRNALVILGILYNFAARDHLVTFNPVSLLRKPPVRSRRGDALAPAQLPALLAQLNGRARIVVSLGVLTGMREGEILGLRWRNVDLGSRRITVAEQYTRGEHGPVKTDSGARMIGIDEQLARELAAWKLAQEPEHKQPDSLVVSTATGKPLSASNFLSRDFYPALKAAGLPRVVFHSLRHTALTALVSSAQPQGVVHRVSGHANLATTLKLYGGLTDDARSGAADAIRAAIEASPDKRQTNASGAGAGNASK